MQFCPIVPIRDLDTYCGNRDTHFALAQWAVRFPEYRDWFIERCRGGDIVILDNGCWEEQMLTFGPLVDVWTIMKKASVVVCPDVMGDRKLTQYLHESFRDFVGPHEHQMGVVQGENIFEQMQMYMWLIKQGFHYIGFPRCISNRIELVQRLKQLQIWDHHLYHHFLGMQNGDIWEYTQADYEGINSGDSSNPVWRGVYGCTGDIDPLYNAVGGVLRSERLYNVDTRCCTIFKPAKEVAQ